jgi:hypothetical protein
MNFSQMFLSIPTWSDRSAGHHPIPFSLTLRRMSSERTLMNDAVKYINVERPFGGPSPDSFLADWSE